MLLGYNFTENFTADIAMGVFRNVYSCFSWQIYGSITIKSNEFAGIKYRPSDFLKKQREYILAWHIAVKKKKKKEKKKRVTNIFRCS